MSHHVLKFFFNELNKLNLNYFQTIIYYIFIIHIIFYLKLWVHIYLKLERLERKRCKCWVFKFETLCLLKY